MPPIRYGVVGNKDLIRDLRHWETLALSGMMLRPFHVEYGQNVFKMDELIQESQYWNLRSGLAFALLVTKDGETEKQLYENIFKILHY